MKNKNTISFVDIPKVILNLIFQNLGMRDLARMERTCKSIKKLIKGKKKKKKILK